MHYRDAFNDTLEKFGIQAKSLALKTGVQERQISLFRNGKNVMAETLFSLVNAMPDEARLYFHASVAGESILKQINIPSLVWSMTIEEKAQLLKDVADSLLPAPAKKKDTKEEKDSDIDLEKEEAPETEIEQARELEKDPETEEQELKEPARELEKKCA